MVIHCGILGLTENYLDCTAGPASLRNEKNWNNFFSAFTTITFCNNATTITRLYWTRLKTQNTTNRTFAQRSQPPLTPPSRQPLTFPLNESSHDDLTGAQSPTIPLLRLSDQSHYWLCNAILMPLPYWLPHWWAADVTSHYCCLSG